MLLAGLRISETLALKWSDIVYLDKPLTAINLKPEHCKRRQARVVPISPTLNTVIASLWPSLAHNHALTHNDYLASPCPRRRPITARTFQRHLATIATKTLGYHINPHMLRHTFATELRQVADVSVVQQALGHARLSTTARYMTPAIDEQATAMAKMFKA
jgi:integrase